MTASVGPTAPLSIRSLTRSYGNRRVFDDFSLDLPRGAISAVIGPNGVGKSTLLACIADPSAHRGAVQLGDRVLRGRRGDRVAYLPQRVRLPVAATVGEVVALFRQLAGATDDRVELPDGFLPDDARPIGQLSGGQVQRVALAGTLLGRPDLLLLDEPLANLDQDARAAVLDLLRAHRTAGATTLVASPTAVDLLAAVDHVVLLGPGRVGFQGAPTDLLGLLRMTILVREDPSDPGEWIAGLPAGAATSRSAGWITVECSEATAVAALRIIAGAGVGEDRIRLSGPDEARVSSSNGGDR